MEKENTKISTGIDFLDELLEGGYDRDIVTTIFGPSLSVLGCYYVAESTS